MQLLHEPLAAEAGSPSLIVRATYETVTNEPMATRTLVRTTIFEEARDLLRVEEERQNPNTRKRPRSPGAPSKEDETPQEVACSEGLRHGARQGARRRLQCTGRRRKSRLSRTGPRGRLRGAADQRRDEGGGGASRGRDDRPRQRRQDHPADHPSGDQLGEGRKARSPLHQITRLVARSSVRISDQLGEGRKGRSALYQISLPQEFIERLKVMCTPFVWEGIDSDKRSFNGDMRARLTKLTGLKFVSGGKDYKPGEGALHIKNRALSPLATTE
eukprot:5122674-Prymnesium_polylepis.2